MNKFQNIFKRKKEEVKKKGTPLSNGTSVDSASYNLGFVSDQTDNYFSDDQKIHIPFSGFNEGDFGGAGAGDSWGGDSSGSDSTSDSGSSDGGSSSSD